MAMPDSRRAEYRADLVARRVAGSAPFLRTTDLWSIHPGEDQRMRLIEALPDVDGALCVDDTRWTALDAELAPWCRTAHNALLGTRDRF
ncbi:hypothetical protein ACGF3C_23175 [Micromonospora sp. NPDC047762]|uniref:hypothetical protein n=1 Tax=Micromonospora sp. NPDC047762 TaxID=3364255 RepID=UPI003722FF21